MLLGKGRFPSFKSFYSFSLVSNENQMVPGYNYFIGSGEQTLKRSPAVILAQTQFALRKKSAAS